MGFLRGEEFLRVGVTVRVVSYRRQRVEIIVTDCFQLRRAEFVAVAREAQFHLLRSGVHSEIRHKRSFGFPERTGSQHFKICRAGDALVYVKVNKVEYCLKQRMSSGALQFREWVVAVGQQLSLHLERLADTFS